MIKFIGGAIIGIAALIFIFQNTETVDITFIAWTITMPRAVVLLIMLVFGLFMGWVISSIGHRKKRRQLTE